MPIEFTLNDGESGQLHVKRQGPDKVSFKTTGVCWASAGDVRKLISELDELAAAIEAEAS